MGASVAADGDIRVSSVNVEPGLYILRYASGAAVRSSPLVEVACDPRAQQVVSIISDPRVAAGVLSGPGAALVVRAVAPASLRLAVRAAEPGGSLEARITLEAVSRIAAASAPVADLDGRAPLGVVPVIPAAGAMASAAVQILGHLARRGDVRVGSGEWLGGPAAPLPIEGVAVAGVPSSLGLEYQVRSGGRKVQWSPWVPAGSFAGSRGRAMPLLGIRFRLGSAGAELRAEALFLGSPIVSRSGSEVELVGLSDLDPMVGLSLSLLDAEVKYAGDVSSVTRDAAAKVRVFRAGAL
ncbi:MAG: hypothetical protein B7Y61_06020 [Rhizobiales bacterium 35-66-30]|nr:MAG: hypothetical protein B7Y61_06020 [Rhizobiales bacterium 35-66-30]OZB04913.1 MAG: hypothetical protein B7X67_13130 [Rhizobiales bacterium 39-66-18]